MSRKCSPLMGSLSLQVQRRQFTARAAWVTPAMYITHTWFRRICVCMWWSRTQNLNRNRDLIAFYLSCANRVNSRAGKTKYTDCLIHTISTYTLVLEPSSCILTGWLQLFSITDDRVYLRSKEENVLKHKWLSIELLQSIYRVKSPQ